jgi:rare lipoprotein A (peptidoglycan hydrolase)
MRRSLLGLLLLTLAGLLAFGRVHRAVAQTPVYGFAGWATYYGIEDGFVRGDIMYDGTQYDPADPTIAAASFLFPLHTWLRVCSPTQCIIVQVRDRGLLDENDVLLDLSRAAYGLLFGSLGGRQWVSAYYSDPSTMSVETHPLVTPARQP